MTQRKWDTHDGWNVLTGWDRPLQHFFVTIDRECRQCGGSGDFGEEQPTGACSVCGGEGNEYLFNNFEDTSGLTDMWGGMKLEDVAEVLSSKLTKIPEGLLNMLRYDQAHDMGNDIRHFGTLGEAKKTSAQ